MPTKITGGHVLSSKKTIDNKKNIPILDNREPERGIEPRMDDLQGHLSLPIDDSGNLFFLMEVRGIEPLRCRSKAGDARTCHPRNQFKTQVGDTNLSLLTRQLNATSYFS